MLCATERGNTKFAVYRFGCIRGRETFLQDKAQIKKKKKLLKAEGKWTLGKLRRRWTLQIWCVCMAAYQEFCLLFLYKGLFVSSSGISELDCATTKTDTAEKSISIGRESLQVFFCTMGLGLLAGSTARG